MDIFPWFQDPNKATQFMQLSCRLHLFNFNQILILSLFLSILVSSALSRWSWPCWCFWRGQAASLGEHPYLILYSVFSWLDSGCSFWQEYGLSDAVFFLMHPTRRDLPSASTITMSDNFCHLPRQCLPGFLTNHYFKERVSTKHVSSPLISL